MKARTILAALVATSFFAVPAFAAPSNGKAPAAAHAKKKRGAKADPAKREARMLAKLKEAGVDDARAKKVVAINKRYHAAQKTLRQAAKPDREAFRKARASKDAAAIKAAKEKMQTHRAKRKALNQKRAAEIGKVLTTAEQAKIKEMRRQARAEKGKNGKRGKRGKAKGKQS